MKRKLQIIITAIGLTLISSYTFAQSVSNPTGSKISVADAQKVLDHHNMARKEVGVPPLTWSADLAAFAQQWADHLAKTKTFGHRQNNKYGENIFMGTGNYTAIDASTSWYGEKKDYTYGIFHGVGSTGHYTQMIWKNTTQVGMGVAVAANGDIYVVANYNPPGNYMGEYPYQR
jgi:pathogenesis-related protein 1